MKAMLFVLDSLTQPYLDGSITAEQMLRLNGLSDALTLRPRATFRANSTRPPQKQFPQPSHQAARRGLAYDIR